MPLPSTMRAAQAKDFGTAADVLTVSDDVATPVLSKPNTLLIKVHAVSLSPSDYRMLHGHTRIVKPPRDTKWPYIPGGDVCGTVIETTSQVTKFRVGDHVIATWYLYGMGGIAEYCIVEEHLTELKPRSVNCLEGAAMTDSPVNAMLALEDVGLKRGERVLILGGSGGMGSSVVQLAKDIGAGFVAATSTDRSMVEGCGADLVIDYRERNWWQMDEFLKEPLDVIIDCAEGFVAWHKALDNKVLKSRKEGGRFLGVIVNEWHIEVNNVVQGARWMFRAKWREWMSHARGGSRPAYAIMEPAPRGDSLARFIRKVEEGNFQIALDPSSPFAFTTEGVRDAFELMVSRRAHGKVVIAIDEQ